MRPETDDGGVIQVRPFRHADVPELLGLMRELAVFEGYIDQFQLREADLVEHGLGPEPRFGALVADTQGALVGMAVHYVIPWTYDLKPTLVLKELLVRESSRGQSVGKALIEALIGHARSLNAARITWMVLAGNEAARRFYEQVGGERDRMWEPWILCLPTPCLE